MVRTSNITTFDTVPSDQHGIHKECYDLPSNNQQRNCVICHRRLSAYNLGKHCLNNTCMFRFLEKRDRRNNL